MHFIALWPSFRHLEHLHVCNLHRDRTPQLQPTSDFTDRMDCVALRLGELTSIGSPQFAKKCSEVLGVKLHLLELHLRETSEYLSIFLRKIAQHLAAQQTHEINTGTVMRNTKVNGSGFTFIRKPTPMITINQ